MKHCEVLHNKAFNIAQRDLALMVYKFYDKNLLIVVLEMRILKTKIS